MSLCLSMIVKNEAPVISRCLASVRPIIDYWVIVDTGSTDGTQDLISKLMADVPGELYERPWRDFAHNRTEALKLAKKHGDYTLIIDADDQFEFATDFKLPPLTADSYLLRIADSGISYQRTQIVRAALPWNWRGVLHEFLACDEAKSSKLLDGITMRRNHDGARRRDPLTYRRDADILTNALDAERDPFMRSRYMFYLAQSWNDCGEKEKSLEAYLDRAEMGFWSEEIFESLYTAGQIQQALGRPLEEVLATYERASNTAPTRAEALHGASRLCRDKNEFRRGYEFAKKGLKISQPPDGLFVQDWIYRYGLLDELAVNGYWCGRYGECVSACDRMLREGFIPDDMVERVEKNRAFGIAKLGDEKPKPLPKPVWTPSTPAGGTELMVAALRDRLGGALDQINLQINQPGRDHDQRPCVVWMHHDVNQEWVQWCSDRQRVQSVDCFVFVSSWQREQYLNQFALPAERCVVIRHALDMDAKLRHWRPGPVLRCAYTSTPFRGLDVLLDAWERLRPANAELHVWSSMKLYQGDDGPYEHLYERADKLPSVTYHGIAPNTELRAALRDIDFLVYPSTFRETFCLAVLEAMAAGCRVIVPSLGALPEITSGYARLYPSIPDRELHAACFTNTLAAELASPWGGHPKLSLNQQIHCEAAYSWLQRIAEWKELIKSLTYESARQPARFASAAA